MNVNNYNNYFFIGIGGTGMSAIAQYLKGIGKNVSGSDRQFTKTKKGEREKQLNNEGIATFNQDGSGIDSNVEVIVVSTAVEDNNVEYQKAIQLKIPIVHRADLLAAISRTKKTVAVSGTSGKSTTSAMIYHIMEQSGQPISFIGGAGLISLQKKGRIGNAIAEKSDWLVIEADESDGSLVKYEPEIGIILNIDKDHKELDELEEIFGIFKRNTKGKVIVNQSHQRTKPFSQNPGFDFGLDHDCGFNATDFHKNGFNISFKINKIPFEIPCLGRHNMENALAAVAACFQMGVGIEAAASALNSYEGIYRRHQLIGKPQGIYIIDDYAHNPAKLAASIQACQFIDSKLIVWFQPHGYKPTRFLRSEFVGEIVKTLREEDEIWMSEIYYAGGTATKDISANDLIEDIKEAHKNAFFIENREDLPGKVFSKLKSGDVLLLTGARDPSLEEFAGFVFEKFEK
ncbi:MAG: Mur ligase family protein [Bacteroidales bacterium]|nr:Mur ligase family protein [Bacteroidales bacterium]